MDQNGEFFQDCQGLGWCSECKRIFTEEFLDQYNLDRPCYFSSSGQPAASASDQKSEGEPGTGAGTQIAFHFKLEWFCRHTQNGSE